MGNNTGSSLSKPAKGKEPTASRLLFVDAAGIRRCRVVPAGKVEAAKQVGVGLTLASMGMAAFADGAVPGAGVGPVGEIRVIPADDSTCVDLPWCPGHQLTVCEFHTSPGTQAWDCCPRSALKRALKELRDRHGLTLHVGFEHEFVLLKPDSGKYAQGSGLPDLPLRPADELSYCHSGAFDAQASVMDDIVFTLEKLGIEVVQYHKESAPGQFEVAVGHYEALEAADRLLIAREAINAIARRHGLAVTFVPKYFGAQAGNGCHAHLSLWRDGKPVMAAAGQEGEGGLPKISAEGEAFVAGLLQCLPSMLMFTAPSVNSFERLAPDCWAGAYGCWGWDAREAPLRMTCPPSTSKDPKLRFAALNVELKAFDASTNPFIALAAIISAGMAGLKASLQLPPPTQINPSELSESERGERQIKRLPASLGDAIQAWEAGQESKGSVVGSFKENVRQLLTPALVQAYTAVRKAEAAHGPIDMSSLVFRY